MLLYDLLILRESPLKFAPSIQVEVLPGLQEFKHLMVGFWPLCPILNEWWLWRVIAGIRYLSSVVRIEWGRKVRRAWLLSLEQKMKEGNSISLLIVFVCRGKKKKRKSLRISRTNYLRYPVQCLLVAHEAGRIHRDTPT